MRKSPPLRMLPEWVNKKKKGKPMRVLLWSFCFIIAGLYILNPIVDPDLWWHIAIGRWILTHGAVPTHEHWNAFAVGKPFRAYSWMTEVLFAWIDGRFGLDGLFWAKLILGQLVALSFFFVFSKISGNWFFGVLLGLIGMVSVQGHFALRPQTFTWIYFAWLLYFCDLAVHQKKIFPAAIGIMGVMCLWANIHITTALGIGAIVFWVGDKERISLTAWLVFFGVLGTLFTPYLGGEWLTFLSKTGHPMSFSSIIEFKPATILQFSTGFVLLSCFVVALFFYYQPQVLALPIMIYGGILLLGGLAVIKFLPYAAIFVLAIVAQGWRRAAEENVEFGNFTEAIHKFQELFRSKHLPPEGLGFILVCVIVVLVSQTTKEKINLDAVPKVPVDFMEEKGIEPPVLHVFGYGGYMMRHFSDETGFAKEKVVIDGRTNVTPHEIMDLMGAARTGRRNWREIVDIVQPNAVLWDGNSPLISLLLLTGEWCIVYQDEEGSVMKHTLMIKRTEVESRPEDFPNAECE
jgi:hypothetical protein